MGQEVTLPEHVKVEIWDGFWTRQDAINNLNKLFLFGGNRKDDVLSRYSFVPKRSQACIRDLPNSIPIITKLDRGIQDSSYFSDHDEPHDKVGGINTFKFFLKWSATRIEECNFDTIVLPKDGIGTGRAYLQQKAPKCWELLQEFLAPLYERAEQDKEFPEFYSYSYGKK